MKVITNSFGLMLDPEFTKVTRDFDLEEFEWRIDERVIALIEKRQNEIKYLRNLEQTRKISVSQTHRLKRLTSHWDLKDWEWFNIIEVDTSKPWVLSDYDTSVSVQYLSISPQNKDINFYGYV